MRHAEKGQHTFKHIWLLKHTDSHCSSQLGTNSRLTLTQLADQLDMALANLSKIENDKRDINEKRFEKLAGIFDLELDKLKAEYFSEMIAEKKYIKVTVLKKL